MSSPKKPGTDLAALKARLAKKAQAGKQPDAPAPAADVPPPGQTAEPPAADIPAPGQVVEPPQPAADIPPPGQVAEPEPPADIPAPGQVAAPAPEPEPEPAPAAGGDEPFAGGVAFDPTDGLIDSGPDVAPRGNKGLMIVLALGSMAFGAMVGYLLNQLTSKKELVEVGAKKGAEIHSEVKAVSDARKTVSLKLDDIKKAVAADPKKGADQLTALMTETFEKHPKVDELFGWQLAAVHPMGVKKVFELYDEANRLKLDLGYLAGFLNAYSGVLAASAKGPKAYAVMATPSGVKMVELVAPLCDLENKKPCQGREAAKAVGYLVRENLGAEPVAVPRGLGEKQAVPLLPEGKIYNYAIGLEEKNNAERVYTMLLGQVQKHLEDMARAENIALKALENYEKNPTVNGDTQQPDPGGE